MENKEVVVQDNTVKNEKEFYEEIEVELIVFDEEDIILASGCECGGEESNNDGSFGSDIVG